MKSANCYFFITTKELLFHPSSVEKDGLIMYANKSIKTHGPLKKISKS